MSTSATSIRWRSEHLHRPLRQAQEYGLLGKNILGSGFDFNVSIKLGSGAFVCGEETALMASIEGRVGEPRPRPPYPSRKRAVGQADQHQQRQELGFGADHHRAKGADWYANIGTPNSKGTMIFSVVGKINNTGLVEVPMGITLRELIYDIGGGIPRGQAFKAAQIGGPSGGCIPARTSGCLD